jgi:hypothetical protein
LILSFGNVGGKLVYQTTKKRASGPKCPVTGKRIQGVCIFLFFRFEMCFFFVCVILHVFYTFVTLIWYFDDCDYAFFICV